MAYTGFTVPRKLNNEQILQVVARREAGEYWHVIAEDYGMTGGGLSGLVKKWIKNPNPTRRGQNSCNHDAFATPLSDEAKYWAGFLMADGCISGNEVVVTLKKADIDHISKFKTFLGFTGSITCGSNTTKAGTLTEFARMAVSSPKLCSDLARIGVVPRKSYTAEVRELENDRHFWRGMIDGDGCLSFFHRNSLRGIHVALVGSNQITNQYLAYANGITGSAMNRVPHGKVFRVSHASLHAIAIIKELYTYHTVSLDRKQELANQILEYNEKYRPIGDPRERIKELRTSRGLTCKQLAELMGYSSVNTVLEFEKSKFKPSDSVLRRYADAFSVTFEYLKYGIEA